MREEVYEICAEEEEEEEKDEGEGEAEENEEEDKSEEVVEKDEDAVFHY